MLGLPLFARLTLGFLVRRRSPGLCSSASTRARKMPPEATCISSTPVKETLAAAWQLLMLNEAKMTLLMLARYGE